MDLKQQSDDKKITLSVSVKGDSFTEKEQREIIGRFGVIAQLLLSKLECAIDCQKRHTVPVITDSNGIAEHFGFDSSTEITVFDSAKLPRELVVLSLCTIDMPTRITIDYDPNYPYAVIRKKGISTS